MAREEGGHRPEASGLPGRAAARVLHAFHARVQARAAGLDVRGGPARAHPVPDDGLALALHRLAQGARSTARRSSPRTTSPSSTTSSSPSICAARSTSWPSRSCSRTRPIKFIFTHGGVFPVMRGRRDEEAFETAHAVLERGGVVVMYCEGGRSRSGELGEPKPGVGRLALETGAPVIPTAIVGTQKARNWRRLQFPKITTQFGDPVTLRAEGRALAGRGAGRRGDRLRPGQGHVLDALGARRPPHRGPRSPCRTARRPARRRGGRGRRQSPGTAVLTG